MFSPSASSAYGAHGDVVGVHHVPLEVLVDLRCESREFDRIVPPTDASFNYDKFNALRNGVVSASITTDKSQEHLLHQTVGNLT
jgi:hypothetical protein